MKHPKPMPVIRAFQRDERGLRIVEALTDEGWREIARVQTLSEVVAIILDERGETEDLGERPRAA